MLNHVVMMKFKPEVTDEQITSLEKMLDGLPNRIVEIHAYEFGRDVIRDERSYDFALVSLFANPEALQRYKTHPAHIEVIEILKKRCEQIITVDFYGSDASSLKEYTPEPKFEQLFK
ncbi:MAG: Dabb family protein [Desulfobacterales bacterium]|nr:Dabb family protein [Desulfobacterales bacterium]